MEKLKKFENVDILESLNAILTQNTEHYQSDFKYDKEIIEEAAKSPYKEDKTLLWLCRSYGTWCLYERSVFLKDTEAHLIWTYYKELEYDKHMLAYAIELKNTEPGKIKGNLYEINYAEHYKRVKEKAITTDTVRLIYEQGYEDVPKTDKIVSTKNSPLYGKLERYEYIVRDPTKLQIILQKEKDKREHLTTGDFKLYLETLQNNLIEDETKRIVTEVKKANKFNNSIPEWYKTKISSRFMRLANEKSLAQLLLRLPFKNSFLSIPGKDELQILV